MKKYSKLMAILLVFAMILAGVAQAAPVVEAEEVNSNVIRLSGADRIKTSVKISQTAYKDGAESVVIVGYEGEVDALAGTLLAHAKKGPVLFTKKGKLSEDTKTEIARLGAKNVYILGGTATIEDAVKTELETLKYTVKRISGSNREGTAAAVAKEVGGKTTHVFLARGYGDLRAVLSDALAVGPASAKGNMAVLLTRTDKVPAATLKSMKDLGVTNVTIVGGEVAVNSGVKTELETLKYTVDRLSGTTREGTAIAIANKYFAGKANALVANGYGSPDALVGGYLGAAIDAPILFSQANKVSEVTTDYLKANTEKAWILDGERVVNKEVLNKVLGAVVPTPTPPSTGGGSGDNVAVSAISVDVKAITLGVGETATITATVEPDNATNKNVTWTTSNAEIATVANGVVTAVAKGEATITATAGGKTAEAVITVLPIATEEENEDMGEFLIGWNTLKPYDEVRGNHVSYQFKLKNEIKDLSEVKVSIFKGGTKLATNTLINPTEYSHEITGSFYTNDIKKTSSWNVEPISGNLGDEIFDGLELRVVYNDKVYIISQTELRPIVGNVKNLTQSKGYDTIQAAIDAAVDGNVIVVAQIEGGYEENLKITKPITLKSISGAPSIKGNIEIKANNVTIDGFNVEATDTTAPVIHMIDSDNINIINNTVIAKGYASIGTSTAPAKVTGKISGNTVTGMIIVGTDGDLEVSDNNVKLTPASTEGICFYPVGPAAEITVTGNTVGQVTGDNVHIKVNEKPLSVNGETNEVDMLAAITAGNAGATAQLSWVKTVGATGADFTTIQDAVNGVNGGDTILVKAGTYTADNTNPITINKKVTLMGDNALINVSTGNQPIQVNADGTVIQGFMITKTDKAHQDIIYINANDVTIIDNVISGQYEFGDAQVDRAILGVSGKTGIQIVGNEISDLRQPAYFNGGNTGDVIDNYVTNTRGWVVCGDSKMSFTGNTFGTNAVDIAIIPNDNVINNYGTTPQEIIEISDSNNGAYVENQLSKISAKDGKQVLADGLTYDAASDTYEISNANGLQYLAKAINTDGTYSGATVKLTQDIKLEGIEWTPIYANGYTGPGNNATLTIDGNGHTISDLSKPLIGRVWSAIKVNIKNLTISGSTIVVDEEDLEGNVGVGAFIGSTDAFDINLENCHLIGSTVKGGHWTGGLVGYLTGSDTNMGKMNILNSSVINSTINGKGSAGSLLGHATGSALANIDITNATVTGNTVTSTGASSEKAGSVMGTVGAGTVKVNNLNESNNTVKSNETIIIDRIYGRLAGGSLVID